MEIIYLKPSEIKPYFRNPRKNENAIEGVAESIQAFGFRNPIILDNDNVIIAGHTRWKAALKLDLKKVPCIKTNGLSPEKVKAYRIADNKYGERSEWDFSLLKDEFEELDTGDFNLELTGFDMSEIEEMMTIYGDEYQGQTDDDAVPEDVESVCKTGDLWQLGDHRLLCGDATKKEDVERLMGGEKADMVFTDPPYALFGNSTGASVADDKMIRPFFRDIGRMIVASSRVGAHFYSCLDWKSWAAVLETYQTAGLTIKQMIVWDKGDSGMGSLNTYRSLYELLMFGVSDNVGTSITKAVKSGINVSSDGNIWRIPRENKEGMHGALKPQELIVRALTNSSNNGDAVLDLFGGSGSTLIACEKTNRKCYMMELDPKYCDVIVNRWEDYTGNKAELING